MDSTRVKSPNFGAYVAYRNFSQWSNCNPGLTRLAKATAKEVKLPGGHRFELLQNASGTGGYLPQREHLLSLAVFHTKTDQQATPWEPIYQW